ncbi:MAG: hypothetical protein KC484_06280, partial [Colwelliaceae bacterium]|nr:hypothetical protein [Colwelliaceae bacterium]
PRHIDSVKSWLARMGLSVADLENGTAMPEHNASRLSMYKDDQGPTNIGLFVLFINWIFFLQGMV